MIARIWHGRTPADKADAYADYIEKTGVKEHRSLAGNKGDFVLKRVNAAEGTADFLVISLWESMDAVRAYAGDDFEVAVYYPEDDAYLLEREPKVQHYEAVVRSI